MSNDPLNTAPEMTFPEAITYLLDEFCLGDCTYDVRSRAIEDEDGYEGESWYHPKVNRFTRAWEALKRWQADNPFEAPLPEAPPADEFAFSCPRCGSHKFGSNTGKRGLQVACHQDGCGWFGKYGDHVRNPCPNCEGTHTWAAGCREPSTCEEQGGCGEPLVEGDEVTVCGEVSVHGETLSPRSNHGVNGLGFPNDGSRDPRVRPGRK